MTDPHDNQLKEPEDDEPLRLDSPESRPPASKLPPDDDAKDVPLLLVPLDEESSREIPRLEPIADDPPPDLPPLFPTPVSPFSDPVPRPPPEAVERRIEVPREEPPRKPPSLYPVDLPGLTAWLFNSLNTLIWMGAAAVLAFLLFGGYLLASVPWIGPTAQVLSFIIGFYLVAAYPFDVLRAAVAGSSGLPDWSDYGSEGPGRVHAAGVLALLAACLLPGLLFGALLGRFFGLPLLLAGWTVFPSALLMYSATGSILATNPLRMNESLRTAGWRYLLAAAPGHAVLVTRVVLGDVSEAPFVLALLFPAMIAAALVVGTLARENEKVGRRLLAIARAAEKARTESEEE